MKLLPLFLFLNVFKCNFKQEKNKICSILFSVLFFMTFMVTSVLNFLNRDYKDSNMIVVAISYLNSGCIFITLFIISIENISNRRNGKSLLKVFKCFQNIDDKLKSFGIKCHKEQSNKSVLFFLFLLLVTSFSASLTEGHHYKNKLTLSQFIYAFFLYILSVKIYCYCSLVYSIRARFNSLSKHLLISTDVETKKTRKLILTESIISKLVEISMIYDETLQIISLLNQSFSKLLSSAFSEY